jgi:diacylglycerol kinase family enzyme
MRQVLLIANPHAGSASPRRKEVIVKALSADFKLEVADTTARAHAVELSKEAVDRGFDAIVAFGGDGTVNEAAQGLVGTDVALAILPGGTANVAARSLGLPTDPIDATAFVAERLRTNKRRRVNVGRVNDRFFLFSAGLGLDAEVVRRVEADPEGKRTRREWLFLTNALSAAIWSYRGTDPQMTVTVPGSEPVRAVTAVCCNARPFTYFKRFPVDVAPEGRLDAGLEILAIEKIRLVTVPRLAWSLLVSRSHIRWRSVSYWHDVEASTFSADLPLPLQVDGDYLGETTLASLDLVKSSLDLIV